MEINQKEIEKVSSLGAFERYQYLLKRIADNEMIYTLENEEGDWASSEIKEYILYPIWSAKEFALKCAVDEWSGFKIIETSIGVFLETVLPEIDKDGFLLNAFPVGVTTGFVVTTSEFMRDIAEELGNY
ncbi:DUF2750 domain-containing protein [Pedobacter nutrimenti]|uniref:DUF2750 domain-containing protein n=1 Tax=Pedobacter nutrimenti TaxID=1241337 RepID=UPI00292D9D4C|nr:DUF2750 domain-containing protein [Pedobacter nutrimenti]